MLLSRLLLSSLTVEGGGERDLHRGLLGDLVWHRWSLPKRMLPASLKNAVVYQIKLNPGSLPVHNEENVIAFHNLVIPAAASHSCLS